MRCQALIEHLGEAFFSVYVLRLWQHATDESAGATIHASYKLAGELLKGLYRRDEHKHTAGVDFDVDGRRADGGGELSQLARARARA